MEGRGSRIAETMDYIPPFVAATAVMGVLLCGCLVAMTIASIAALREDRTWVYLAQLATGFAACIVIAVVGITLFTQIRADEADLRASTFSNRYGWEPTPVQLHELRYPNAAPKVGTSDFYGHADINVGGGNITVQLAWDGKKIVLLDMSDAQELSRSD